METLDLLMSGEGEQLDLGQGRRHMEDGIVSERLAALNQRLAEIGEGRGIDRTRSSGQWPQCALLLSVVCSLHRLQTERSSSCFWSAAT